MPENRLVILIIILIIAVPLLAYKQTPIRNFFTNLPLIPRKEVVINVPKSSTPSANLKKPYICPSIPDFCQKGTDVNFNGQYAGFGASLPKGSKVVALFDGKLITSVSTLPQFNNEQVVTVTLENRQLNLTANYFYQGQVPTKLNVKAGEQISVTGEAMTPYQVPLMVQFYKGTQVTGEKVHLTPKDFGF